MYTFCQNVLIGFILICSSRAKSMLNDRCSRDTLPCPENSECRPLSCLGYQCTCNEGFMPNDNNTECIKGAALGENCGPDIPCINTNAICMKPLISITPAQCQCENGYINTNNLQCLKENGYKRFGQWCEGVCGPTLTCTLGFCQCKTNYRQRTIMEIQVDPYFDEDCIENEFSLSKCRDDYLEPISSANSTSSSKNSTDLNADSPDATAQEETENDKNQYDLFKADNQTSNVSLPASLDAPTSTPAPDTRNVFTSLTTDRPMIPTSTPNAMGITSPSQNSTETNTDLSTFNAISKSQVITKLPNLKTVTTPYPTSLDMNTSPILNTSTLLTKLQDNATPSHPFQKQQSSYSQVRRSNTITTTGQTFQTMSTQSTDLLHSSRTGSNHIPETYSSPVTTDQTPDSQNQTTVQIPHSPSLSIVSEKPTVFTDSSKAKTATEKQHLTTLNPLTTIKIQATSSVAEKSSLPTTEYIPTETATSMTRSIATKIDSPTVAFTPTKTDPPMTVSLSRQTAAPTIEPITIKTTPPITRIALTTDDLVGQNVTKDVQNENEVTRSPAIQTDPQPRPSSRNRISTEAIVIPSVLVIILAIIITSVIAIIVCKKRRSHISLSTVIDSNTYKLPRPSMMSQALTSAPSSPYDHVGSRPSYHYVNEAFENNRL